MELLEDEKERIVREFKREIRRLDHALEETSEFISAITHYAGIVSFLDLQDRFFYRGLSRMLEQPEFRDSDKIRFLIRAIEDKRRLLDVINRDFQEKVKVYIGTELGYPEMESCALVVSSFRVKNKPSGKIGVLGPMRMEYKSIIPTVEYISDLVTEIFEAF